MGKLIICIDFDGVIHSYDNGWQNGEIYGTAVDGFFRWAIEAQKYFRLVVYSSRSKTEEGIRGMREWIGKESISAITRGEVPSDYDWSELFGNLEFASEKPPAFVTIDDRAIQFRGLWYDTDLSVESLKAFKPWNAKRT